VAETLNTVMNCESYTGREILLLAKRQSVFQVPRNTVNFLTSGATLGFSGCTKCEQFFDELRDHQILKKELAPSN
jgi:hypothetical protein